MNRNKRKEYIRNRCIFAVISLLLIAGIIVLFVTACSGGKEPTGKPSEAPTSSAEDLPVQTSKPTTEPSQEATEPPITDPVKAFELTAEERDLVEQVVSAESRGEPYEGQMAVCQCILNACLKDNLRPADVFKKYGYTKARVEATESVKEAVAAVFDNGEGITDEPILYFYNPKLAQSSFHESQTFVVEIANHKFFKEAE